MNVHRLRALAISDQLEGDIAKKLQFVVKYIEVLRAVHVRLTHAASNAEATAVSAEEAAVLAMLAGSVLDYDFISQVTHGE